MNRDLAVAIRAAECLEQGRLDEAITILDEHPVERSPLHETLSLIARGLRFEREGDDAQASRCLDQALDRGVPLALTVREAGRYFKRNGQYDKAFQCYSLLRNFDDPAALNPTYFDAALLPRAWQPPPARNGLDAVSEFLYGLPPEALARYAPWAVRELSDWIGLDLWRLPVIKQALVVHLGPQAAVLAFAGMTARRPGWDVATLALTSLRDYAQAKAAVYEELIPARKVSLPGVAVFGGGGPEGGEDRTRTVFVSVLEDVIVPSRSNLVLADGHALLDYQGDELQRFPIDLDVDPVVFDPSDESVTVLIDETATSAPALPSAFHLLGANSDAFGHWMLEFLPKVFACLHRPGFGSVPLLIDEGMPPQHREALEFFLGSAHPVHVLPAGEAVRVQKLWVCPMLFYMSLGYDAVSPVDAPAFARLIERLEGQLDAATEPGGPRRIYLTRPAGQRRLVNRQDVEDWFAAQGFAIFDFGELSFREQLKLARGADVMVGPDGSSLLMSFFARPGTRVGVLSHPFVDRFGAYEFVTRALDQRVLTLTGTVARETPDPTKSNYRIDTELLPGFLEDLLSPA